MGFFYALKLPKDLSGGLAGEGHTFSGGRMAEGELKGAESQSRTGRDRIVLSVSIERKSGRGHLYPDLVVASGEKMDISPRAANG